MPSLHVEAQRRYHSLLETIGQFGQTELDQFVAEVIALRARRQAPSVSFRESALLMKINQHLSSDLQARFDELIAKRRKETLTNKEHQELLRLIDQVERMDAVRIEALTQLAHFRGVRLDALMDQLGIKPPEYA